MRRTALAFMSYVNLDDQHEQGRLTRFRELLSGEVRMQTGEAFFDIFQDRKDIAWGQQWQERINQSLDAVTFLIPIITPGFFKSAACREELERFLKREEELGRSDLILPVYYVTCPVLRDKVKREHDKLAQVIAARQYADWRDLRFEKFTSSQIRKALATMAEQIVAALERRQEEASFSVTAQPVTTPKDTVPPPSKKDNQETVSYHNMISNTGSGVQSLAQGTNPVGTLINNYYSHSSEDAKPRPKPAAKTKSPTVIVDQNSRGDYATITEALETVKAGTRILVRPGLYKESIVIDKPVEIIGDGDRDKIVIESFGKSAVLFKAKAGSLINLTLRQVGSKGWHGGYGVDIAQGKLIMEDCDISSQSDSCVVIHSFADPSLRRCRIHDGKENGISFSYRNGILGILEDNDIFANALAGVDIAGGHPTLRRNRITKNGDVG
ncbi:TIR domain-containing protein, partial [Desulfobulbus sp. TB]|nr:TIR domain-containing protein [Desulfobulbus sp. TB]